MSALFVPFLLVTGILSYPPPKLQLSIEMEEALTKAAVKSCASLLGKPSHRLEAAARHSWWQHQIEQRRYVRWPVRFYLDSCTHCNHCNSELTVFHFENCYYCHGLWWGSIGGKPVLFYADMTAPRDGEEARIRR